jgi:hypothetical protein
LLDLSLEGVVQSKQFEPLAIIWTVVYIWRR